MSKLDNLLTLLRMLHLLLLPDALGCLVDCGGRCLPALLLGQLQGLVQSHDVVDCVSLGPRSTDGDLRCFILR